MNKRGVIVSVINDLVTDRRVHRTCTLLEETGFEVLLVGRRRRGSLPMDERTYKVKRMRLWFEKGALFYVCYNLRLFLFLCFRRTGFYVSNDLDTLLPNYLVSRIKRKPLLYDSHEYFTGVPELANRHFIRNVWKLIERAVVPKLKVMVTVNDSIAGLYNAEYGTRTVVVRNVPEQSGKVDIADTREQMGLPVDKKILILQGSGINVDRGGEEAVEAMQYLEGVLLLIVGDGDVIGKLKSMVSELGLGEKMMFISKVPLGELKKYTSLADGGLTLDKDTNINYRYSLPNKVFDYIHASIPVLASNLPEVRNIVEGYDVGLIAESFDPAKLALDMKRLLFDENLRAKWRGTLPKAADSLCWEKEKEKLKNTIGELCRL